MLYILHGEDSVSSRNKLNELLTDRQNIERFNLAKDEISAILLAFSSQGLFSSEKIIVIEETGSLGLKKNEGLKKAVLEIQNSPETDVFLYHTGEFSAKVLGEFKKAKVFFYPLPKYFFQFLDSFMPGQGKALHSLLFKLYPSFAAEQILYALIKRTRLLLMLTTGETDLFSETQTMSPWQKNKLSKQLHMWNQAMLIEFYKRLFTLEFSLKTSALTMQLINHIDILLLTGL